jgi:predicted CxxxxCH...CXXCH cytochrome family protein
MQMGFSTGGGIYDGRALQPPYTYEATNGTVVTANGSMTCSNIYCHSDGTSVSTYVLPAGTSPSWVTPGPLACGTCHGYPPQYGQDEPKSNTHVVHQQQLSQHSWFSCATCHAETTGDGATIANTVKHVNGEYDVSPDTGISFTYTYARGGGTCSNITCHEGNYHNGDSRVWGNVVLDANISVSYGPGPYQVTLVGSVTGGTAPYMFHWEFDDGSTADGSVVTHTYASSGPYFPRLTVTDANFHTGNRTTQVNPFGGNILPVAAKSISVANRTVTLTDLSYDTDYNLYGHSGTGTIRISWGDGTPTLVQSIALTGSPSNIPFTHTYAGTGTNTFTVTHAITDNAGGGPVSSPNVQVTVPVPLTVSGRVTHSNSAPYPGIQLDLRRVSNNAHIVYATTNFNGDYTFTVANNLIPFCPFKIVPPTIPGVTFSPTYTDICTSISNANITATP